MSLHDPGGPAFPTNPYTQVEDGKVVHQHLGDQGMTLRDYFAAKAMQSRMRIPVAELRLDVPVHMTLADSIASVAYEMADAMLKARSQ